MPSAVPNASRLAYWGATTMEDLNDIYHSVWLEQVSLHCVPHSFLQSALIVHMNKTPRKQVEIKYLWSRKSTILL